MTRRLLALFAPSMLAAQDFAIRESARMERLSSEYRQLGFPALAAHLKSQSNAALKYAIKEPKR